MLLVRLSAATHLILSLWKRKPSYRTISEVLRKLSQHSHMAYCLTSSQRVRRALLAKALPPRVARLLKAHPVTDAQELCDSLQDTLSRPPRSSQARMAVQSTWRPPGQAGVIQWTWRLVTHPAWQVGDHVARPCLQVGVCSIV